MEMLYDVGLKRIRQKRYNYCGPACLEMVGRVYGIEETQETIWENTRPYVTDSERWYTDPAAMSEYLDRKSEITQKIEIADYSFSSSILALKKMIRTLTKYKHSPAFLINRGAHWVVMAAINVEFSNESLEEGVANTIFVANPGRNIGTSGLIEYVLNEDFFENVFNPVDIDGEWMGKLVSIVEDSDDDVDILSLPGRSRPLGGGVDILAEEAADLIIEDLEFYGMGQGKRLLAGGANNDAIEVVDFGTGSKYYYNYLEIDGQLSLAKFNADKAILSSVVKDIQFIEVPNYENSLQAIINEFGSLSGVEIKDILYSLNDQIYFNEHKLYYFFTVDGINYLIDGTSQITRLENSKKIKGG